MTKRSTKKLAAPGSVRVERKPLLDALVRLAPAVTKKKVLPILASVHIAFDHQGLHLRTSDLDLNMATLVQADVTGTGEAVVDHKSLTALARWATDEIVLTPGKDDAGASNLRVTYGGGEAVLSGGDIADYPRWPPVIEEARTHVLSGRDVDLLRRVATFASPDECRPILTTVRFAGDMAATDSYRLGVAEMSVPADPVFLFPVRGVWFLPSRILEHETLELQITDSHIQWSFDGTTVAVIRTAGEFPNVQGLIDANTPVSSVVIDRAGLIQSLRRIQSLSRSDIVQTVRLCPDGKAMKVSGGLSGVGQVEDLVSATFEGEVPDLAFNPEFLRTCLEAMVGAEAHVGVSEVLKPAVFTEDGLVVLLMPVRVT